MLSRRVVAAASTTLPNSFLAEQEEGWKPGWVRLGLGLMKGLLVGRTLVDLNHKVLPVRVMNMSAATQKIKKGSDVARCELVEVIVGENENILPPANGTNPEGFPDHIKDLYERSAKNLSAAEQRELRLLLLENANLFSKGSDDLGRTDMVHHQINTGESAPIRQPPRRLPLAQKEADKAVQDMSSHGLIEPCLATTPVLCFPLPNAPFILDTDASGHAIGAVLSQVQEKQERVVAYYSRTMNRAEEQYCVTRKELLAIVEAVKHFHPYLTMYDRHFTIRSDHATLQWLLKFRKQEYDFQVKHRAGHLHT